MKKTKKGEEYKGGENKEEHEGEEEEEANERGRKTKSKSKGISSNLIRDVFPQR